MVLFNGCIFAAVLVFIWPAPPLGGQETPRPEVAAMAIQIPALVDSLPAREQESLSAPMAVVAALGELTRPDRWKLSAEMSYTDQSGNNVLRLLTGGIKLTHREKEAFELESRLQSRYGKSEGEVVARNHYAALSVDLRPTRAWSPSFFFDAERDEFRRLNLRFSGGAGAKYTLYEDPNEKNDATVSLTLLYSYEDLTATEQQPRQSRSVARWNLRGGGNQRVNDSVTLEHATVFQPVWGEMADYLLRSETGAKVLLTERLALSVSYQLSRNNRPPDGVDPQDRLFKTGFIIDF